MPAEEWIDRYILGVALTDSQRTILRYVEEAIAEGRPLTLRKERLW